MMWWLVIFLAFSLTYNLMLLMLWIKELGNKEYWYKEWKKAVHELPVGYSNNHKVPKGYL